MNIILIFIIAVSLSMDAFSLSLAYGTISMSKKEIRLLSIIVGIYHFFMPILGMLIGKFIFNIMHISGDLIVLIIFSFIGINMIIESLKKEEKVKKMKLGEMILFGLAVSIDSFSVGIGINNISDNFIMCSSIFSITSFMFTYIGLKLGNKLNQLIGKISTIVGGVVLILFGLIYIIK
ncbi:MAG: manganese efflux pump [Bacilli bacterium]|nr:manganese efflux pump [Bacilli bacterium]